MEGDTSLRRVGYQVRLQARLAAATPPVQPAAAQAPPHGPRARQQDPARRVRLRRQQPRDTRPGQRQDAWLQTVGTALPLLPGPRQVTLN